MVIVLGRMKEQDGDFGWNKKPDGKDTRAESRRDKQMAAIFNDMSDGKTFSVLGRHDGPADQGQIDLWNLR